MRIRNRLSLIGLSLFLCSNLFAQDKTYVAPDVNVISVSPVQGSGINIERVPSNVCLLYTSDAADE